MSIYDPLVMRIPLPGLLLAVSTAGFIATWVVAPRDSLSGHGPDLPAAPAARAPLRLTSQAVPSPSPVPSHEPPPTFVMSQPYRVALTFDDGPHHVHTERLLSILAAHRARATFFVNGCWLAPEYQHGQRNRELLARTFRDGHVIGNHAYHHVNLGRLPREEQSYEILTNEQIIESVLGVRPYLFRPPYGILTRHSLALLRAREYVAVRWNAAVADEESREPGEIRSSVMLWLRHHGGGIVMLHDRNRSTVEGTELILRSIEQENCRRAARGEPPFRVVPLDSFLQPPGTAQKEPEQAPAHCTEG